MNRRHAALHALAGAITWGPARAQDALPTWTTYSNAQMGVAFEYPATMKVTPYQPVVSRVAEFMAPKPSPYAQVNFDVAINATDRNLTDYISAYLRVFKAQISTTTVGGVAAIKGVIAYPNPGAFYYFMPPGTRALVFSLSFMWDTHALERKLLDSVRFFKPDGSFAASKNAHDYGASFGSDDSPASKWTRQVLGIH